MSNINKSIIAFCKSRRIFLHMFQVIYIQTVEQKPVENLCLSDLIHEKSF